jgi:hypothetical protein
MKELENNKDFRNLLLGIAILMAFVFIVSASIYFIINNYSLYCACALPIPLIIVTLASLGVFVGVFTYYFLSKSFLKNKKKILGNIEKTLNFLDSEEKKIVLALINNNGEITQSSLSKITGINPVKLHRRLLQLESKEIIYKEKNGMTNKLFLEQEFKDIFIN